MPTGRKTPETRHKEFVRDLEAMSSIDILDLLTSHLVQLEGSFGGRHPWEMREVFLQRCRAMTRELRTRENQGKLL